MKIDIDTTEVRELVADWTHVPDGLARLGRPIVSKGLHNITKQLREEMGASRHFRAAKSISYELDSDGYGGVTGPTKTGAGPIANIAYFGGSNGGGGTVADPRGALDAEAPKFMEQLAKLAEELLR